MGVCLAPSRSVFAPCGLTGVEQIKIAGLGPAQSRRNPSALDCVFCTVVRQQVRTSRSSRLPNHSCSSLLQLCLKLCLNFCSNFCHSTTSVVAETVAETAVADTDTDAVVEIKRETQTQTAAAERCSSQRWSRVGRRCMQSRGRGCDGWCVVCGMWYVVCGM